jgi:hypothetical protein
MTIKQPGAWVFDRDQIRVRRFQTQLDIHALGIQQACADGYSKELAERACPGDAASDIDLESW